MRERGSERVSEERREVRVSGEASASGVTRLRGGERERETPLVRLAGTSSGVLGASASGVMRLRGGERERETPLIRLAGTSSGVP